uniref:ABC transporter substrate-binding protein n=1 Tax=Paracoccus seriniphilus TaxID=184748 RepID=UPI0035615299
MWDILKSSVAAVALLTGAAWGQDSITIGMVLEPPNLDPTGVAAAATDEVVYANLFEGLTRFGPDGSVRPALAASWDVEDEGRSYLFHLRKGVTFHDGTAFDAEDVRFSLDRARAADSTNAQKQLFAGIEAVEIVDPLTVRVRLTQPDGNFPFKMAWGDAVMVSQD